MFKTLTLALLGLCLAIPLRTKAEECAKSLKEIHGISTIEKSNSPIQTKLDTTLDEVENDLKLSIEKCGNNPANDCINEVVADAHKTKKFVQKFKDYFSGPKEKACVIGKQQKASDKFKARSNMALNLLATGAATMGFYKYEQRAADQGEKPQPKFNYALLVSAVGMTLYRSIVQCQNEIASNAVETLTPKQKAWKKFWRYTKLNVIGNSAFVSLVAVQDYISGENPFDPENLKSYGVDFVFGLAWDSSWSVLHIKYLDGALINALPNMTKKWALAIQQGWLKPVIAQVNGRPMLVMIVNGSSQIPGLSVETLARFGLTAARTGSYLGARAKIQEIIFGLPENFENAQE